MLEKHGKLFSGRSLQKKYIIRRIAAVAIVILLFVILIISFTKCGKETTKETAKAEPVVIGPFRPDDINDIVPLYTSYDYSFPVPEAAAVSESWFDDALFIGDSRVSGFSDYAILDNADIVSGNDISASNILEGNYTFNIGSGDQSLNDILISKKYDKVYLSLGTNELSWSSSYKPETFEENLLTVIDVIRGYQSSASIYLMNIIPVSSDYSWSSALRDMNNIIASVALQKSVYFLDVSSLFDDGTAHLDPSYDAGNGIGITVPAYNTILEYLSSHTVDKGMYKN